MDVALALDALCPAAIYTGSLTENSEEAYNAVAWADEREQPLWADIVSVWPSLAASVPAPALVQQLRGLISQGQQALFANPLPVAIRTQIYALEAQATIAAQRQDWDAVRYAVNQLILPEDATPLQMQVVDTLKSTMLSLIPGV